MIKIVIVKGGARKCTITQLYERREIFMMMAFYHLKFRSFSQLYTCACKRVSGTLDSQARLQNVFTHAQVRTTLTYWCIVYLYYLQVYGYIVLCTVYVCIYASWARDEQTALFTHSRKKRERNHSVQFWSDCPLSKYRVGPEFSNIFFIEEGWRPRGPIWRIFGKWIISLGLLEVS